MTLYPNPRYSQRHINQVPLYFISNSYCMKVQRIYVVCWVRRCLQLQDSDAAAQAPLCTHWGQTPPMWDMRPVLQRTWHSTWTPAHTHRCHAFHLWILRQDISLQRHPNRKHIPIFLNFKRVISICKPEETNSVQCSVINVLLLHYVNQLGNIE